MRYEPPRRWLLGPASSNGDGLGHSPAWLIGPSGATLGRRPDYSITSSARVSSVGGTSSARPFAVLRLTARTILVGNSLAGRPAQCPAGFCLQRTRSGNSTAQIDPIADQSAG